MIFKCLNYVCKIESVTICLVRSCIEIIKPKHRFGSFEKPYKQLELEQGVPKKRLPFEVKRQSRMFEFECLNSLMIPGMRKTFFMLTVRINLRIPGLIGDLKHSNSNMRY